MTTIADDLYESFFRGNIEQRKEDGFSKEAVLQWLKLVSDIAELDLPEEEFEPRLKRAKEIINEVYGQDEKVH